MGKIRVMIADDDEDIRNLVATLVSRDPSLELAGAACDTVEAITLASEHQPDVALLDLDMPGGGGWKAAAEIRECSPATQILAFSGLDTPETRLDSHRSGAVDFVPKGSSNEEIVSAIRRSVQLNEADIGQGGGPFAEPPTDETAPGASGDGGDLPDRVADLERRMSALEQSMIRLLGARG
jgi:DNA-binding NarL/FixJ family response regulator